MTSGERVVDIAEGEVGVREWGRPNRGGCEKYQRPWGSWMIGQAWCGAFVAWVWQRAGLDGMHLASPSTQQMCNIARSRDLECSPRPGSSFVICSVHTGIVAYAMGGGVYKTIEGNSGDAVRWRQRSLSGLVVYGPPGISGPAAEPAPVQETWYYLEDVAMRGVREWGGWSSKAGRNGRQRIEEKRLGKELRPFKRNFPSAKAPYFFEDVSQPERFYGGWRSQKARNDAQVRLQRALGRNLRRFSAKRAIGEPDADALGKGGLMAEVEPLVSGEGSPATLGAILNDAGEPVPEPPPLKPTDVPLADAQAHPEPEGPEPDDVEEPEPPPA